MVNALRKELDHMETSVLALFQRQRDILIHYEEMYRAVSSDLATPVEIPSSHELNK